MVILLLWPYWSKLFQGENQQPAQTADSTQVENQNYSKSQDAIVNPDAKPATMGEVAVDKQPAMTDISEVPEKTITIENEDAIVTLSSHGGLIKSIKLKKYYVENGKDGNNLVELLAPQELNPWNVPGALTLGDEGKILPINGAAFEVSGYSIVLHEGDSPRTISFTYNDSATGAMVRKDYTFQPTDYRINLRLTVENPKAFGFDKRITIGWLVPSWPTEKDFKGDLDQYGGFYNMGGEVVDNKDVKDGKLEIAATGSTEWVANRTKYFCNVILAEGEMADEIYVKGSQSKVFDSEGKDHNWEQYGVGLTYDIRGDSFQEDFLIYSGPLNYYGLEKIGHNLSQLVDMGWKVFRPFAIAILWILVQLQKLLGNFGIVIIIFSLAMKVVFWPLTQKSSKSMMKMKELQPKIQEVKEKFSNDAKKLNEETMKIYKEHGFNPFGSCLPIVVQMPIFWALFSVLRNSIELRGAEFLFWITDLSQKDSTWVLPVLMGLAMFFQQKMTITDPKQKMMAYIMPVVFVFIFGKMASGLVLYWTVFSVVGVFEQILVKRKLDKEKLAAA